MIYFVIALVIVAVAFGVKNMLQPPPPGCTPYRRNPNALEPDVFASPEADLDPESDNGEPKGWN